MKNILPYALASCLPDRRTGGAEEPLERFFAISCDCDRDQPAWEFDLEHRSQGFTQEIQLVALGRTLVFGVTRTPGSDVAWLVVPFASVVQRASFVELLATTPTTGWKRGAPLRVLSFVTSKELDIIETDPADRVRLLSLLGDIFSPDR